MKGMRSLILLCILLGLPASAAAQDVIVPRDDVAPPAAAAPEAPGAPSALPAVPTPDDPFAEALRVREQLRALQAARSKREDRNSMFLAAAALLAAVLRFVMAVLTRVGTWTDRWGAKIPALMLILGALVTVLTRYTADADWFQALMLGLSGPLAVAFHEMVKMVKPKPKDSTTAPAPQEEAAK